MPQDGGTRPFRSEASIPAFGFSHVPISILIRITASRGKGFAVARCTIERLMREMRRAGVIRGKPMRTTISDKMAPCPRDHVNR